jgi:SMI1-KNR4 cell-wall
MEQSDNDPIPFWFSNGRPGATPSEIDAAEQYIGHRLPQALRSLLLQQNGGVSNYSSFSVGNDLYPVLPFFGADSQASAGTLMRAFDVHRAFGAPDGVIPFAGQGDCWWGLDYRVGEEPGIVFRADQDHPVVRVASSLENLLGGLIE